MQSDGLPYNEHLYVQREHPLHEGVWYVVESRTPLGRMVERSYEGESAFCGRGAKARALKAFREMSSLLEGLDDAM